MEWSCLRSYVCMNSSFISFGIQVKTEARNVDDLVIYTTLQVSLK
jgi:hypothetical protein